MNIQSFGWELRGAGEYKLMAFLTFCILENMESDSSAPEIQQLFPEGEQ